MSLMGQNNIRKACHSFCCSSRWILGASSNEEARKNERWMKIHAQLCVTFFLVFPFFPSSQFCERKKKRKN